jgi:CRISPR-associated protein Csm3
VAENSVPRIVEKLSLRVDLELLTGLHIGGGESGLGMGVADRLVVRAPATSLPYVPGSSLKGRLRSLVERAGFARELEVRSRGGRPSCDPCSCARSDCPVCLVFGVPAERTRPFEAGRPHAGAARLRVRDAALANAEEVARFPYLDLVHTEVKTEVGIDRLTSAATPRHIERVPAGARFESRMILDVFDADPREDLLDLVLHGLRLLSADHLGGQGSRGYGAVTVRILGAESLRIGGEGLGGPAPLPSIGSQPLALPVTFDLGAERRAAA